MMLEYLDSLVSPLERRLTGIPVIENSELLKPGQVIIGTDLIPNMDGQVIVAHGLAIVWMTYEKDGEEVVRREAQRWISRRIDAMANAAIRKIEEMYQPRIIGVIAEGPLAGTFAREGYKGKVLVRGDFTLAHA